MSRRSFLGRSAWSAAALVGLTLFGVDLKARARSETLFDLDTYTYTDGVSGATALTLKDLDCAFEELKKRYPEPDYVVVHPWVYNAIQREA